MRAFRDYVKIVLLTLIFAIVFADGMQAAKFRGMMSVRATLPIEIVVPTLWTQCVVMPDSRLRCETMAPAEWEKLAAGTRL